MLEANGSTTLTSSTQARDPFLCWNCSSNLDTTASLKWRRVVTHGPPPSGRNYHTASVIGKKIYVFGGFGNNVWLNDMHVFDTEVGLLSLEWISEDTNNEYIQMSSWAMPGESADDDGEPPAEHSDHVAFVMGKNVCIFGGYGSPV